MIKSLKKSTLNSLKWSGIQTGFSNVFHLIISILLAKLLTPEIFGMVGLLNVILTFSQIIVIGGFGTAIIQKKDISDEDINTVFFFNIIVAISIFVLLGLSSPWISEFFQMSYLQDYIFFYSLLILLSSIGIVPRALLAKDLNYKRIAHIGIFSSILSGISGLLLAYHNYGIWSIITQQLIYYTLTSSLYLFSRKWAFKPHISINSLKTIGSFGFKLMLAQLLNASSQNIINIMLAKFFPIRDLGIYDRSYKFSNFPSKVVKSVFSNVYISSFSHIQDDPKRIFKYFDKTIGFLYMVLAPIIFTIYVFSEQIIRFLGTNWLPMIPLFKILLIISIFTPLHTFNLTVLKSQGKGNYFLFLEIVKKILLVAVILSTFRFGIMGLAVGQVIAIFIEYFINSWYTNKLFNIKWHYQLKVIFSNFIPILLVMVFFEFILNINNSYQMVILYWLTGCTVFILWMLRTRRDELSEMNLLVKKLLV